MAVVKADGYGHGAVPVARCLRRDGVRAFGVACLAEGIALRKAGVLGTILILGYTPPREVPLLRHWHLTQTVADEAHGRRLAAQGRTRPGPPGPGYRHAPAGAARPGTASPSPGCTA